MVAGPIGTYYLTLNTIFGGKRCRALQASRDMLTSVGRELYAGWSDGGCDGELGACGLRRCGYEGGPE